MSARYQQAEEQARVTLNENYVTTPPVDVREIVRNYGLNLKEVPFPQKLSNVAGFIDPDSKSIYVNCDDSIARKNFTIAHELGHWILHQDKLKSDPDKYAILYRIPLGEANKDPIESEANTFAASLLVPREMFEKHKHLPDQEIAKIFNVSTTVIGYRRQDYARTAPAQAHA